MARILIVEDDRPFADTLAIALQLEKHDVLVAASASEAIRLGTVYRPDVVIADWMLGGGPHGGEICQQIQAAWPPAKAIIMTGYLDAVSKIGLWPDYAELVLEKPFHKEAILEAVDRALSETTVP